MYLYDILYIDKGDSMFIELFNIFFYVFCTFRVNKRKENLGSGFILAPRNVDSHPINIFTCMVLLKVETSCCMYSSNHDNIKFIISHHQLIFLSSLSHFYCKQIIIINNESITLEINPNIHTEVPFSRHSKQQQ